jgi:quercetin dioxygenase-like cupin family protein
MEHLNEKPHIFHIQSDEALEIQCSSFGSVGKLFSGEGIEAVWVKKQNEEIDPDWFSQPMVDLILVLQGKLKMEFERIDLETRVLCPGDVIMLPPDTHCRAYRWPREEEEATVFLAVYPIAQ